MIKYYSLFIILLFSFGFSQENKIIYLPETKVFSYPDLFIKAGFNSKRKAIFDVVDFKVQNIRIESLDSANIQIINEYTKQNLDGLIFVNDTSNYSIIFEYIVTEKINNDHVEYYKPGYIRVFYKKPDLKTREYIVTSSICDDLNKTVTASWWVNTYKSINIKSDILVKCLFQMTVRVLVS